VLAASDSGLQKNYIIKLKKSPDLPKNVIKIKASLSDLFSVQILEILSHILGVVNA